MKAFFSRRAAWPVAAWGFWAVMVACGFVARAATLQSIYPAATPLSGLVSAQDGNFYGTSRYGGTNDLGAVFRLSTSGNYQTIYSFTGAADGSFPGAALTIGPDGQLYGTCQHGGTQNAGSIFKITTAGDFTLVHALVGGTEGAEPIGGLAAGTNGRLFGTASSGGASGFGTVFRISTNSGFLMLHSFSGNDGNDAEATLTPGADGLLYGTTRLGGASNCGTVFNITTAGTFTPLFSFNGANGAMPAASLVQGADEAFYGTTAYGGAGSFGSIFKITPAGTFTSLHSMAQEGLGSNPFGGLVFGPGGILYGSANYGGADGFGLVFQLAPSGVFSPLYHFTGNADGGNPSTTLAPGSFGNFFGTTSLGGAVGGGIAYQLTTLYFDTVKLLPGGQAAYGGPGGVSNGLYTILTTTNLLTPPANWTFLGTNQFDAAGRFRFTNTINPHEPARFYGLSQP